jgi:DNA-binding FadR family transcriptional regulator
VTSAHGAVPPHGEPDEAGASGARADEALFRPVRDGNAFEETVERLLSAVRLGVVRPGERLPPERDLAVRFRVSRVTLREAIRALQTSGYLESRRGRYGGTFVAATLPRPRARGLRRVVEEMGSGLDDALVLRQVLETGAAETAASCDLGAEEQAHLRARLDESTGAGLASYRRMDSRLHLAIAEVTGSPSLTSAVADVRMRVNDLLDAIPLLERNLAHSNEQHAAVVEAVCAGEPARARALMAEHLDGTTALLRGFLA